eukprot:TCALIF_06280-PA protein Name:"Similar to Fut2 Galactoside 2-alpha-L-fucosyltransferase 2 (Mus musculus)" AED:0.00 eAED:0.00 QI:48/1/1/1/1/1/4/20/356
MTPTVSSLSDASQERLDQLFSLLREQVTSLSHVQKCLDLVLDGKTDNEQNGCPTHEFVMTTFDAGGLGNKMSEYATLLAISTLTGFTPVLSEDHYNVLIEVFPSIPFNGSQISKSCMEAAKPLNPGNLPETMAFLATRPQDRMRNIRLNTYPNAVFYYDKVKGILKDHFTFMPKVAEPAEEFLRAVRDQIKSTVSEPVWVGVHVRRTNYKHHLNVTQNGTLVTLEYFQRAMVKLKETLKVSNPSFDPSNLVYVVSSDDVPWIKTNFRTLAKAEIIIYAADAWKGSFKFQPKFLDMCIMSKCNHSIFDYGTFGFWGAYLADGHTILSHNIGSMENSEVENIKPAKLSNWHFIDAHGA